MVTLTAVGQPDPPLTYFQRQQAAAACLLAAREAIDSADRALMAYQRNMESVALVHKGYQRAEYEQAASRQRTKALDELAEAVRHLSDAVRFWFPAMPAPSWLTDDTTPPDAA